MSSAQAIRLGGLATVVGAVLTGIAVVISSIAYSGSDPTAYAGNALYPPVNLLAVIGSSFLLVGLPVVYVGWADRLGVLGLLGVLLIVVVGVVFGVFLSLMSAVILPFLVHEAPDVAKKTPPGLPPLFIIGTIAEVLGSVLLAIPFVRGLAGQRWVGWALIVSAVFGVVSFIVSGPSGNSNAVTIIVNVLNLVLFFVPLGWIGYQVWTGESAMGMEPSPSAQPQVS